MGLEWSNEHKVYAGGSTATGVAFLARQDKGDDPDWKGYTGLPGGMGLMNPPHKNNPMIRNLK